MANVGYVIAYRQTVLLDEMHFLQMQLFFYYWFYNLETYVVTFQKLYRTEFCNERDKSCSGQDIIQVYSGLSHIVILINKYFISYKNNLTFCAVISL